MVKVETPIHKLWLDDVRNPPDNSYTHAKTALEAIYWLARIHSLNEQAHLVCLDHDLGDETNGTGYDVLLWIEKQVRMNPNYVRPKIIRTHTANPPARARMQAAIKASWQ